MAYDTQTEIQDFGGMTLKAKGITALGFFILALFIQLEDGPTKQ